MSNWLFIQSLNYISYFITWPPIWEWYNAMMYLNQYTTIGFQILLMLWNDVHYNVTYILQNLDIFTSCTLANSEDPDEMLHMAAFHQELRVCCDKTVFRDRNAIQVLQKPLKIQNGQFHTNLLHQFVWNNPLEWKVKLKILLRLKLKFCLFVLHLPTHF